MKKMKNENQPRSSTQKCEETSSCDEKTCPTKKKKKKKKTKIKKKKKKIK